MKTIHLTAYRNPAQDSRMVDPSEPDTPPAGVGAGECLVPICNSSAPILKIAARLDPRRAITVFQYRRLDSRTSYEAKSRNPLRTPKLLRGL